ncbi:MAG: phenylalanine--tRNA ligase subunit beta [Eubacteriaceae bacterium]|jgi:phenylalanyl-tRNA synthetase beta chain|nr:phenylalanine--tRNA ligase subunit beta [Eubacteriaceae bacterium]
MLTPVLWLKDYAKIDGTIQEFGRRMTLAGTMVEEISWPSEGLSGAITAQVLEIARHPDSEHLWVCQVWDGEETETVVTGAQNVSKGDIVPYGKPGACLPGRESALQLQAIRGVNSFGMLLSAQEMGIPSSSVPKRASEGIFILPKDTPVGIDVSEALGLSEAVIDFELTNNRQDCNSVLGIAAEAEACQGRRFSYPEFEFDMPGEEIRELLNVAVEDYSLCRRYTARMLRVKEIAPSPLWMQNRLMAAGIRPINNVVDVSNFVMVETGQPLHMFDYSQIEGGKIIVRQATGEDSITTLDGVERKLSKRVLMIDDAKKHIGVAGIMGGMNSEITDRTKLVVIEAANFDKSAIRNGSRAIGVRSESAARFEKGLATWLTKYACDRAASLLFEMGAAELVEGVIDCREELDRPIELDVEPSFVNRILGTTITRIEMARCLYALGFTVKGEGETMHIEVPRTRSDILIKEDIAEEIARIYGYECIPLAKMAGGSGETPNVHFASIQKIKAAMMAAGGSEMLTYTFLSPEAHSALGLDGIRKDAIQVRNPLGEDSSLMRTSLLHGLFESLGLNYRKKNAPALLFEAGPVFLKNGAELPEQKYMLAYGSFGEGYIYIKRVTDYLLERLKIGGARFVRSQQKALHPQRSADVIIGDVVIGAVGEAHPGLMSKYGIAGPVAVAELECDYLAEHVAGVSIKAAPIAKYPAVSRDLAVVCDELVLAGEIQACILEAGGNLLRSCEVFDVYKSESLGAKKSVAFSLKFQSEERTLLDEEISASIASILRALEKRSVMLRE